LSHRGKTAAEIAGYSSFDELSRVFGVFSLSPGIPLEFFPKSPVDNFF
jgi:hypothetical protein